MSILGSLLGGVFQSGASSKATKAQVQASQQGMAAVTSGANQAVDAQQPYQDFGKNALGSYAARTGGSGPVGYDQATQGVYVANPTDYIKSPGYQHAVNEAQRQTTAAAAAGGYRLSGANVNALQQDAYNLANADYWNWANNAQSRADQGVKNDQWGVGIGQQAATNLGNIRIGEGNSLSRLLSAQGDARATNALTQGNIISGGIADVDGLARAFIGLGG